MARKRKISYAEVRSDNMEDAIVVTLCAFLDCYETCPQCLLNHNERCNYNEALVVIGMNVLQAALEPELMARVHADITDEQYLVKSKAILAQMGRESING